MLKYWIWLASVCRADVNKKLKILNHYGSPKDVFFASDTDLKALQWLSVNEVLAFSNKKLSRAYEILQQCNDKNIDIITIQDAQYPERLRNIYDPPLVLYLKGRLPAVDEKAGIAVVGTRKCTPYGMSNAKRIGYELARADALVISGLAAGIDSAAAVGAVSAGKPVIGVLGCCIDEVYPKSNTKLYADVETVGALVSEYPPGHPVTKANFPARNRIISGLSVGVVIIEAPQHSGALITASMALEQGRELFVVPGNVDSFASMGSNKLLSESVAKAVIGAKDILIEFEGLFSWKVNKHPDSLYLHEEIVQENYDKKDEIDKKSNNDLKKVIDKGNDKSYIDLKEQLEGLSEDELNLISHMTTFPIHIDDLIEMSKIPVSRALSAMTMLQIKGHVAEHTGKRYSLIIIKK